MADKINSYEVKVVVWEYYYIEAKSELHAFMTDLEDPAKVVIQRRIIKKVKLPNTNKP